jgi:hypothetical protein
MTEEEENLYNTLQRFKDGYDKLYVIKEELDDLVKMGYDGPFIGEEISGLLSSYNEFTRWENEQRRKEKTDS